MMEENKKQIARIRLMERRLNRAVAAVKRLTAALDKYEAVLVDITALDEYYGSELWRQDLADDEAGRLPADLRRGVLSEDGAYDALCENRRLLGRMAEIAAEEERFTKEETAE